MQQGTKLNAFELRDIFEAHRSGEAVIKELKGRGLAEEKAKTISKHFQRPELEEFREEVS